MLNKINLKILVVGTGRCGTVYLAKLLTSMNKPCTHEAIFTYKGLNYAQKVMRKEQPIECSEVSKKTGTWIKNKDEVVAESSYMAAPFIDDSMLRNTTIIHVVRHPIEVINSFVMAGGYFFKVKKKNKYERNIGNHLQSLYEILKKDIGLNGAVTRAMHYYYHWNKMIQEKSKYKRYFRYRIESQNINLIRKMVNGDKPNHEIDTKTNTWEYKRPKLTWDDLPNVKDKDNLKSMALAYGYKVD